MTETEITPGILQAILLHPLTRRAWKQNVGRMRGHYMSGPKGMPDIDGWTKDGRRIGIEIKSAETRASVSAEQIATITQMQADGCVAGFVTTAEEALAILDRARR